MMKLIFAGLTALVLAAAMNTPARAQPPAPYYYHHDDDWQRQARFRCTRSWDWWCSRHCWRNERGWLECRPRDEDEDRDDSRYHHHDTWRRWP